MAYQREEWHSGLTYQQICETCKNPVKYTDWDLDFRPWYPDGFVDCPVCKCHLRHNEKYAIDAPAHYRPAPEAASVNNAGGFTQAFCPNCGKKFEEGHAFCTSCGTKRA